MGRAARIISGLLAGLVARAWLATLRVKVEVDLGAASGAAPWVMAFFHGTQWPLLAWRRRHRTAVIVSLSLDGTIQASALGVLGFSVVRGSSSRGGQRALAGVVRELRRGSDAAIAVDGPRGPRGVAKGGARLAARAAGATLVPMGAAVGWGMTLHRTWDDFVIAWPFSRVVVRVGAPIHLYGDGEEVDARVSAAITAANSRARWLLSAPSEDRTICGP